MSLPRYEKYKDSGVEWLGKVPEHWEAGRFSRVIQAIKDGTHGSFVRTLEGSPLLSAKNVQDGNIEISGDESLISFEDHLSIISNGFPQYGDLLLTIVGTIGRSCIYSFEEGIAFQRSVCFIRFVDGLSSKFFYFFTKSKFFQEQLISRSKSAAQGGVYMGDVCATSVVYPNNLLEQNKIVSFLEYETAKIDALITEQQKLIELLKEKRQAVISHAVTKGLNPDVKMKDSGIEWLGEVPEHWEIIALKRDLVFLTSGSRGWAENYADDGNLFIRIGNLTRDSIELDLSDIQRVKVPIGAEGERTKVQSGDILFSITAYLGSVAVVPDNLELSYVSQHVALARAKQNLFLPEWIANVTLSDVGKTYLGTQGYGGTKIQLSLGDVGNMIITAPPIYEQKEILLFLDSEIQKFRCLLTEAQKAISFLQERRTALISAAVTGKIDVRGLVEPPQREATP